MDRTETFTHLSIVVQHTLNCSSQMRMCEYGVSVGKVRISSASTSALYYLEHPHIRILPVAVMQRFCFCVDC